MLSTCHEYTEARKLHIVQYVILVCGNYFDTFEKKTTTNKHNAYLRAGLNQVIAFCEGLCHYFSFNLRKSPVSLKSYLRIYRSHEIDFPLKFRILFYKRLQKINYISLIISIQTSLCYQSVYYQYITFVIISSIAAILAI